MTFETAIVLGSTRGIGRALVKRLAQQLGQDAHVYLTARSEDDGQRTVTDLATEGTAVEHLVFDLADPAAPQRVADELKRRHGGVDIVVQNGAVMPTPGAPAAVDARPMVEANSHGTLRVLRSFLPILNANGRIVVVASSIGVLARLPEPLQAHFVTTSVDPEAINAAMDAYVASVEAGTAEAAGLAELGQRAFEGRPSGSDSRLRSASATRRPVAGRGAHQHRQSGRHADRCDPRLHGLSIPPRGRADAGGGCRVPVLACNLAARHLATLWRAGRTPSRHSLRRLTKVTIGACRRQLSGSGFK